jgi:hypothetical protein
VPRKPSGSCSFEIAAKANGSMPWNPVTSAPLKRSRSELEAQGDWCDAMMAGRGFNATNAPTLPQQAHPFHAR